MNFSAAKQPPPALSSRFDFSGPYGAAMMLTLCAAAALLAMGAQAQTAPPAAPAAVQAASQPQAAQTATAASAASAPRYNTKDLEQAFGFMDGNKDGKVSRDESASFRNVAKHFDEADTDKDQALSPEEFESAMNRSKAKSP